MESQDVETLVQISALKYVESLQSAGLIREGETFDQWVQALYFKLERAAEVLDRREQERAAQ